MPSVFGNLERKKQRNKFKTVNTATVIWKRKTLELKGSSSSTNYLPIQIWKPKTLGGMNQPLQVGARMAKGKSHST